MNAAIRRADRVARRVFAGICLAVLAAGCAAGPDAPKWLAREPHDYPEEQYVSGVGKGSDPEAAADAARAEVARKSKGETENVEVVKTYVDTKTKAHWALAVLDRKAALDRLAEELAATEQRLADALTTASDTPPEQAIAPALEAIAIARQRDSLLGRIANLGGTSPSASDASPTRAALDEQLAEIKHALAIEVDASEMDAATGLTGSALGSVRRALVRTVLEKGFALTPEMDWGESPAWLIVRARVAFEPLDLGRRDDFHSVEWEAALEIVDRAAGGRIIALLTQEARATHVSRRAARRLAEKDAEAHLVEMLSGFIDEHYAPKP